MNCKNCGYFCNDSKYCSNCGAELINETVTPNDNTNNNYNQNNVAYTQPKKSDGLWIASLVIGIISLLLSFVLTILIIPLAIIGLVLGIASKKKGNKVVGIVLNSLAIIVSVVVLFIAIFVLGKAISSEGGNFLRRLYNELDYSTSDNYIAAEYDCKDVDNISGNYLISLYLYKDNTYIYGPYGDLTNNHFKGTYSYEDEHKTNNSGDYKYFMITFDPSEYMVNGRLQSSYSKSKAEIGISNEVESGKIKKNSVLAFPSTGNIYACFEK